MVFTELSNHVLEQVLLVWLSLETFGPYDSLIQIFRLKLELLHIMVTLW